MTCGGCFLEKDAVRSIPDESVIKLLKNKDRSAVLYLQLSTLRSNKSRLFLKTTSGDTSKGFCHEVWGQKPSSAL